MKRLVHLSMALVLSVGFAGSAHALQQATGPVTTFSFSSIPGFSLIGVGGGDGAGSVLCTADGSTSFGAGVFNIAAAFAAETLDVTLVCDDYNQVREIRILGGGD